MSAVLEQNYDATTSEFDSGETVDPGVYVDLDSGSIVKVQERDTLPEGVRVVHYNRRFRRVEAGETPRKN